MGELCVAVDHRLDHSLHVLPKPLVSQRVEDGVPEGVNEDAVEREDLQFLRDDRGSRLDGIVDDVG